MNLSKTRQGELLMFAEAILGGALPIVAVFAYRFASPLFVLALSNFLAILFFSVLLTIQRKWKELRVRKAWKLMLLAGLINGVFYYVIYFMALHYTSPGNVAIIAEMEIWSSFIFFGLILRQEKYTRSALLGSLLMFIGVILVIFSGSFKSVNFGDILILFSSMLIPAGNYFQQKLRKYVSSTTLLFARSLIAFPFLFAIALIFSELPSYKNFVLALPLLAVSGFLIFGLARIFWIEAIHRISVAKARSIYTFASVFTLIYAYLFLGESPTIWQLAGLVPIIIGVILITSKNFLHEPPAID